MANASHTPVFDDRLAADGPLVASLVLALIGIAIIAVTDDVLVAIGGLPLIVVAVGLVRMRAPPIIYLGVGLYAAILIGGWALIGMPYGIVGWLTAVVLAATLFVAVARFTITQTAGGA